jgi:hypothetical protein
MTDISNTIIPKSDQLNADDLIIRPLTIRVTKVIVKVSDQPVIIHYENDGGKPFKPAKSMRRVLAIVWGTDGDKYAGKSMTLYNDPTVKWAGADVGGIRISHMSDMDDQVKKIPLTISRGKKILYTVERLNIKEKTVLSSDDFEFFYKKMNESKTIEELNSVASEMKSKDYADCDAKTNLLTKFNDVKKLLNEVVK